LKKLGCAGSGPGKGKMSELAPLQGMKLAVLDCGWSPLVVDLSALKGMPLTYLNIGDTGVADLSPLQGMNLNELRCGDTAVSDLSSLIGMNLASLNCDRTQVSDLSPLRGMKLRYLYCQNTPVSAFAAIEGCDTLRIVQLGDSAIPRAAVAALQKALPNCKIEWDALTRASPAGDGAKPRTPEPAASGTK
jgi:hypothetical protein